MEEQNMRKNTVYLKPNLNQHALVQLYKLSSKTDYVQLWYTIKH